MQWYYSKDGAQFGPVDDTELRQLARSGDITPDSFVWNETLGNEWKPASSFSFLFFQPVDLQPPSIPAELNSDSAHTRNGTTPNRDLMRMARESLKGKWGMAVIVSLILLSVSLLIGGIRGSIEGFAIIAQQRQIHATTAIPQTHQALASTPHAHIELPLRIRMIGYGFELLNQLLACPLLFGYSIFFLNIARRSEAKATDIFKGFPIFWKTVGAYFLMLLFILLWSLLLIIPGIIAAFSYSMIFFILADDPTVGPFEAIKRSKAMMQGKRWKLFCLYLRFLGWSLLALLTCGIGFFWVSSYWMTACAHFYLDVKDRASLSEA